MSRLLSLLASCAVALLCCPAVSGQSYGLYSFCYTLEQTLATSPYLPFSIITQGTLNVSLTLTPSIWAAAGASGVTGYPVVGATGTRTIVAQGLPPATVTITGVAPTNSYGWNDNLIQLQAPYLTSYHSLTFTTSAIPTYAAGISGTAAFPQGQAYVNVQNYLNPKPTNATGTPAVLQEIDNPLNDGNVNTIRAYFLLASATSFGVYTCPYQPAVISIPASTLALYQTSQLWTVCWQFSAGGFNTGAYADGVWTDSVQGTLNTTGYLGTTVANTQAYLILGFTGTRAFSLADTNYATQSQSIAVTLGSVAAANKAFNQTWLGVGVNGSLGNAVGNYYADNVYYPTFPYFDTLGMTLQATQPTALLDLAQTGAVRTSQTTVLRAFFSAASILTEYIVDVPAGGAYQNRDGFPVIVPQANFTATGLTLSSWATQTCSVSYGTVNTYQFCYYLDYTAASVNPGTISAYGTFTAIGPALRNNRMGYLLQSMNGVRTVFNQATGVTTNQNIIALKYTGDDSTYVDNVVYTTAPYFDGDGILIQLYQTGVFLNYSVVAATGGSGSDIKLYSTNYVAALAGASPLYEEATGSGGVGNSTATPMASFQMARVNASAPATNTPLTTCRVSDTSVAAPPTLTSYSFCYVKSGNMSLALNPTPQYNATTNSISFVEYPVNLFAYNITIAGALTAYNTPITTSAAVSGTGAARTGYAVSSMLGVRQYIDTGGNMSSNPIVGPASNYYGSGEGYYDGFLGGFDQLIYTTAPYIDTEGLLFQYNGTSAYNIFGPVPYAPIDHLLLGNLTAGQGYIDEEIIEIVYTNQTNQIWFVYHPEYYGQMVLVQDGGVSGAAGTVAQQYCGAPPTITVNFAYSITNTLASSPYGPWTIYVTGTMTVSNIFQSGAHGGGAGYVVIGATGTRTLSYQGKTVSNNILGVAPNNTWALNDNIVYLNHPNLGTTTHGITLTLDGVVPFPSGPGPNAYLTIVNYTGAAYKPVGAGIVELGMPLQDGITQNLTSMWDMRAFNASYVPPFTAPVLPTLTAAAAAQFTTPLQWTFCFTSTGGPGVYGLIDGGNWTISTSGIMTTTSYLGTNAQGLSGYLVTNITGTRSYKFENGTTQVVPIIGVGTPASAVINAPISATGVQDCNSGLCQLSNNVFYPTWPYFDSFGVAMIAAGSLDEQLIGATGGGNAGTNVARVLFSSGILEEWVFDTAINEVVFAYDGNAVVAPYTAGTSVATFAQQCSFTYGPLLTYQFCYYLDNSALAATSTRRSIVSVYGTMSGYAPPIRNGRTGALQLSAMNGVRTVTTLGASGNTTYAQNIVAMKYVDSETYESGYLDLTDNLVFSSAPQVTYAGFIYTMSTNATFAGYSNASTGPDINLSLNTFALTATPVGEYQTIYPGTAYTNPTLNFNFSWTPFNASNPAPTTQCSQANPNVPAPPTLTTYSYCYYHLGSVAAARSFYVQLAGTMTAYNQPITGPYGRTGYALTSITGVRQFADLYGSLSVNPVTGLSSTYIGNAEGFLNNQPAGLQPIAAPTQLIYPGQTPLFDQGGVLYAMSGTVDTVNLTDTAAPIARLFFDSSASNYGYTEQIIFNINPNLGLSWEALLYGQVAIVADNGASAAAGTIAQQMCGVPPTVQMQFCYTITNTLTTSPWLTWTVTASGFMNVSTLYTAGEYGPNGQLKNLGYAGLASGYQVSAMSGTRTVYYQGQKSTQSIVGVAPVNAYNYNDNVLLLQAPYFDTLQHSVSYVLSGPAAFADGFINGSPYVNINGYSTHPNAGPGKGMSESDLPLNDGTSNVISSAFQLRFDYFGILTCTLPGNGGTDPLYVPPTSTQLAAFTTPGPQYAFCWSHTGGPGQDYASSNGQAWQITSSGVFTTAGYAGTTANGRPAWLITGVTGSRTYQFENGSSQVVAFAGVGKVNAMANYTNPGAENVGYFGSYFYGNNILYPTYPQLDAYGVVLVGTGIFNEETEVVNGAPIITEGSASDRVIRVLISSQNMLEYIWDPPTQYIWTNNAGYGQFQPYTNQNLSTYGSQCYYSAGTPTTFSYCYWLQGGTAPSAWTTYGYGLAVANGPSIRENGTAYSVQQMNGVRTFTIGGTSYVTNVLNVQYPQQDLNNNTANDNLLYASGGYALDIFGVTYTMRPYNATAGSVGPNGVLNYPDIELKMSLPTVQGGPANPTLIEGSAAYALRAWQSSATMANSGISFSPYSGGAMQQCSAPTSWCPPCPCPCPTRSATASTAPAPRAPTRWAPGAPSPSTTRP